MKNSFRTSALRSEGNAGCRFPPIEEVLSPCWVFSPSNPDPFLLTGGFPPSTPEIIFPLLQASQPSGDSGGFALPGLELPSTRVERARAYRISFRSNTLTPGRIDEVLNWNPGMCRCAGYPACRESARGFGTRQGFERVMDLSSRRPTVDTNHLGCCGECRDVKHFQVWSQ